MDETLKEKLNEIIDQEAKKYKLEPHILALLTPEGFDNKFFELLADYTTQLSAYEALERMYETSFHKRKYKNFESYRQSRNKRLKK